ncbi:hypothetical protein Tco_0093150 [Tanacetum coccineum]
MHFAGANGKSNCYLNEEKSQPSPIFKIAMDILKQTNFFRAFTASSTIPAIYIQQFWDTICFDSKTGSLLCCQLGRAIGLISLKTYSRDIHPTTASYHSSRIKTELFSPPPTPDMRDSSLSMSWMWENFNSVIHNFTKDKRIWHIKLKKEERDYHSDPNYPWGFGSRFWVFRSPKLIIFHLQRLHNFHPRPKSPLHLPTEGPVLANLNKVARHQRYLAGEEVSDPDSPAPKPAKPTKQTKPKPTKQSKPTEPKAASKKPKPAPAKPQEKKRKPVSESSDAPPLAKRAKAGKVVKKRTAKRSKQLVDEFIDEGVPTAKPSLEDTEEAILQKVLEESLTDAYPTQRGPLPPVVFREPDTGKLQPLPEVPGKGKEKVGEEQAAQAKEDLPPFNAELDYKEVTRICKKCLSVKNGTRRKAKAGPTLIIDPSSQPQPEHMDKGFTAEAYPDVQENLKLTVDEQVIPEEPISSTGMLSSLQHLAKDFSFGDQFFNDKPSEADNEKTRRH